MSDDYIIYAFLAILLIWFLFNKKDKLEYLTRSEMAAMARLAAKTTQQTTTTTYPPTAAPIKVLISAPPPSTFTTCPPPITCPTCPTFTTPASTTTIPPVIMGRYVKISRPAKGYLHPAEIKVMSNGVNVAANAIVTGSSQLENYTPDRLVNGNLRDFPHTNGTEAPWFLIDMKTERKIDEIVVHNRWDCCWDQLQGAVVEVFGMYFHPLWKSDSILDTNGYKNYTFNLPSPKVNVFTIQP